MTKYKNKEDFATKKGFNADLITYIIVGKNTYYIKETLKELGYIFCRPLGWHSSVKTELPEGYQLIPITFDEVYEWSSCNCCGVVKAEAEDKIYELTHPKKEVPEGFYDSDYFGLVGERLRNLPATLVSSKSFDSMYGTTYCHTFLSSGNVLIWFTSAKSLDEFTKGETVTLNGTVKKHNDYNGIKQTILSRCIIKPIK